MLYSTAEAQLVKSYSHIEIWLRLDLYTMVYRHVRPQESILFRQNLWIGGKYYKELFDRYPGLCLVSDARAFEVPAMEDIQWSLDNFLPTLAAAGLRHFAFILPQKPHHLAIEYIQTSMARLGVAVYLYETESELLADFPRYLPPS